jgi:bifunctional non-homologous end joining protein LigD
MLAKLWPAAFSDKDWIFECKLDGERCLAFRNGKNVRLMSRNRKPLNDTYPELAEALEKQPLRQFVLDGEVVAFEGGVTNFSRLQQRLGIKNLAEARRSGVRVFYYLFDAPYLGGRDLSQLGVVDRKDLLKRAIAFGDPLRFCTHRAKDGALYFKEACRKGWEGLMAKRANSPYVQARSSDWRKFKCSKRQEFVVGGFTDPQRSREGFGALLVGFYRGSDLLYAGKVGTGYDVETLHSLRRRLSGMETEKPSFKAFDLPRKDAHWVSPKLVAEVAFAEWTKDHKLRHPRFIGLRSDKDPKDVVKEG